LKISIENFQHQNRDNKQSIVKMPATTDYSVFAERFHNTLGKPVLEEPYDISQYDFRIVRPPVKKQMPVPRLPFELISSIILEATTTQHQENLDAWKQNIAQINTSLETSVNTILVDDYEFYECEDWEEWVQTCWNDEEWQIEGMPAYWNLFQGGWENVNIVEPHLDDLGWWGRH